MGFVLAMVLSIVLDVAMLDNIALLAVKLLEESTTVVGITYAETLLEFQVKLVAFSAVVAFEVGFMVGASVVGVAATLDLCIEKVYHSRDLPCFIELTIVLSV